MAILLPLAATVVSFTVASFFGVLLVEARARRRRWEAGGNRRETP